MLTPVRSAQFRRDVKRAVKRGRKMTRLRDWKGYRDLHVEPDWLLIYRVVGEELHLVRTGSHSDLFDE
ncbi:MAG: putative addiction module toxin, RelE/StbE family [Rhizobium sp.]|nr:putative addiction module toxin, RelE/StbE family [Rhizobium sp.]